eukprot:775687_1
MEDYVQLKIIIVGDGTVGKTCLLIRLDRDKFPTEYIPTLYEGFCLEKQYVIDNEPIGIVMDLWDTAGQSEFDRLRHLAYRETDVILFCFSLVEKSSLENIVNKWVPEADYHEPEAIKVLVGTKCDLKTDHVLLVFGYVHQLNLRDLNILDDIIQIILLYEAGSTAKSLYDSNVIDTYNNNNRIADEDINNVIEKCNFSTYMETSAKDGRNVQELFETAIKAFLQGSPTVNPPPMRPICCTTL